METTLMGYIGDYRVYWGSIGIMEKTVQITIWGLGFRFYGNV